MELKRNRRNHIPHRRPRKRNIRVFAYLFIILLLLGGYLVVSNNRDTPKASVATVSSKTTLSRDVQFAWPTTGQAAIGSIEDGLLARSSDNEVSRPTASMAKVITALAIMEKQPFKPGQAGRSYAFTSKDVANYQAEAARGGSVAPVHEGLMLTQYQAMQAMLIASGNNIADTLVEKTFGSKKAYVSYAQAMLKQMGLTQTIIADASGFNPATISTPSELIAIGIAALKSPVIADIVAQPQAWIPGIGIVKNTNELIGVDGVFGIKTGTTDEAGSCLLFAAHYTAQDGQKITLVGVIMGDTDASSLFSNSRELLASAVQGYNLTGTQAEENTSTSSPKHGERVTR